MTDPTGLAVIVNGATADLTWNPSTDPRFLDYSVFRRSPPTGAAFNPNVDTPVATGITDESYSDSGLVAAAYDWQVFGRLIEPADVAGLVGDWNPALTASITSAAGKATAIADQSGSGFHLSNTGGAARPTTGAHTQNGLNVLEFDGAATWLKNSSISVAAGNVMTVFAVVVPSATNGFERIVSLDKNGNDFDGNDRIAAILRDGSNLGMAAYYNNAERGTKAMTNAAHVVCSQRNGDSHVMRVDGVAGSTVTGLGTANFGITNVILGAYGFATALASFYAGYMGRVLWYNAALSAPNIAAIEAFLKTEWGTP